MFITVLLFILFSCEEKKRTGCGGKLHISYEQYPEDINGGDSELTTPHDTGCSGRQNWYGEIWEYVETNENTDLMKQFENFYCRHRYYCYVLIDPMKLQEQGTSDCDLGDKLAELSIVDRSQVTIRNFVNSIFYVGKGKNDRIFEHFRDTLAVLSGKKIAKAKKSEGKIAKIKDIWNRSKGLNEVIALKIFDERDHDEALAIEYFLIETIGLENLTNKDSGKEPTDLKMDTSWVQDDECQFCAHLLIQAHQRYKEVISVEAKNGPLTSINQNWAEIKYPKTSKSPTK